MCNSVEKEIGDNYKWFKDNFNKLIKKHNRKWVVIYNKNIVYEDNSRIKCYDYVLDHNMMGKSSIQFCGEKQGAF